MYPLRVLQYTNKNHTLWNYLRYIYTFFFSKNIEMQLVCSQKFANHWKKNGKNVIIFSDFI